jgi:hypothetical protein
VRGGLHPIEVELVHPLDVIEDSRQLTRHPLDLVVRQLKPRQSRDVQNLLAIDHGVILGGDFIAAADASVRGLAPKVAGAVRDVR